MTERAPTLQLEIKSLIQQQITTLQQSSFGPLESQNYHARSERLKTLYEELDEIAKSHAHEFVPRHCHTEGPPPGFLRRAS